MVASGGTCIERSPVKTSKSRSESGNWGVFGEDFGQGLEECMRGFVLVWVPLKIVIICRPEEGSHTERCIRV